jgi:hypothetical protein
MADGVDGVGTKAVKLVGEAFAPGASLVLDGDMKGGALHLVGGLAARALLGPIGWALIAADSYSKSTTGKHFHQHFFGAHAGPLFGRRADRDVDVVA